MLLDIVMWHDVHGGVWCTQMVHLRLAPFVVFAAYFLQLCSPINVGAFMKMSMVSERYWFELYDWWQSPALKGVCTDNCAWEWSCQGDMKKLKR